MVVLAMAAWLWGLRPALAAGWFAAAALPAFATFVLLPVLNDVRGAMTLMCAWVASVAVLAGATGGATSALNTGFVVVLAQGLALARPWRDLAAIWALAAFALAAVLGRGGG
jgi:hypothetical protein